LFRNNYIRLETTISKEHLIVYIVETTNNKAIPYILSIETTIRLSYSPITCMHKSLGFKLLRN
jgi:hypothetical protein